MWEIVINCISSRLGLKCKLPEGETMDWELTEKMPNYRCNFKILQQKQHPSFLALPMTPNTWFAPKQKDTPFSSAFTCTVILKSTIFVISSPSVFPYQNSPSLDDTMSVKPGGILIADIFFLIQEIIPAFLSRISVPWEFVIFPLYPTIVVLFQRE